MNSIQLAQRLARHLTIIDLATMPGQASLDILDAMNAGIQETYNLLPGIYKNTTVSASLKAPVEIPVTVAAKYGNLITTDAFTADMRGCSVTLCDSPVRNEITGINSFLDGFLGNTNTGTATVHYDAVPMLDVIERIVSDPKIFRSDGSWWPLVRRENMKQNGPFGVYGPWFGNGILYMQGTPRAYWLEPVGASQETDINFFFRVYPMPDTDYTIRFEAELSPRVITYPNITQGAVAIPLTDRLTSSVLVPICEEYILRSPFWKNQDKYHVKLFTDAATTARNTARNLVARDVMRPNNSIGTPGSVGNGFGFGGGF